MRRWSRRRFLQDSLALSGLGLISPCSVFQLQPPHRSDAYRIGTLQEAASPPAFLEPFREGLRDLGYVEGQTIGIEARYAEAIDELPELADDLVRRGMDVIVTLGTPAALAAKYATHTIPIVFALLEDPVGSGMVTSLAKPSGNATGLTPLTYEIGGKQLQLLLEVLPSLTRLGALYQPGNVGVVQTLREMAIAAHSLGVGLQPLTLSSANELPATFDAASAAGVEAIFALTGPAIAAETPRVTALALEHRLPLMGQTRSITLAGGMMTYGPSFADLYRRAGVFVDRIIKGARPADLPVEQPTTFDFVINLRTAAALGISIPNSVLEQATELIR